MATPTLRAVRGHFGRSARIVGILRPQLAELLSGSDWLDETWAFDPKSGRKELGRFALVQRMRRHAFDAALLLTNSLHTAALAWLGGAQQRMGYARDGRSLLLTHRVPTPRDGRRFRPLPMVDSYLALAHAMGSTNASPRLELFVTQSENDNADRVWQNLGLTGNSRVVALNCSGAFGAAKLWPSEHCATLARRIVERLDCDVLVLCGPGERHAARAIAASAGSKRVHSLAAEDVSLSLTKACLARCELLVSTDSGPRHIAAALGKPVVTLLGPTLPVWIENPTVRGSMLQTDLDCLGCGKRTCPLGHHRCMRDLLPERVCDAIAALQTDNSIKAA